MTSRVLAPILISLIVLSMVFPAKVVLRAHAATTGLVCIASISDVAGGRCPTAPPSFNGPLTTPSILLRVPVMINNTDTFNGFDITVNSTRDSGGHSVLKPYGVDLSGSIAPFNSIPLAECAGTVAVVGSSCSTNATIDNPTSIRVAVIFPTFLTVGTSGLLFTAIFSINGTSSPGGVSIVFQNHCDPNPSRSSNDHLCISISNGTTGAAPENAQTGMFDNSDTTTLPYATLSTTATNLGQSLSGSPAHSLPTVIYSVTAQNGFETSISPQLTLSVSFNGTGTRPSVSLNTTSLDLTGLPAHPFTQTGSVGSNVPAGLYMATVTATYQTADLITFTTDSLSAAYSLPLNVTDFVLSTSVSAISIQPPSSQQITVTIAPKAGFNNPVTLGLIIPPATASAGITATYSATTILGGAGTSTLTVATSPNTLRGSFQLTITANCTINGFSKIRMTTLTITTTRPDFAVSANPTSIILPPPTNNTLVPSSIIITLTSFNFTGLVQLTVSVIPPGLGLNLGLPALLLPPNGQNSTTLIPVEFPSTSPGTYRARVTGTSGTISHSVNVTFIVPNPTPGDFAISANPTFVTLPTGSATATSMITASSLNGFSGSIVLSANSGFAFALVFNASQLNVAASGLANSALTITGLNLAAGSYTITVTGTHVSSINGTTVSISHSVVIFVQVLSSPPDFQLFVNTNLVGDTILAGTTASFGVQVNSVGSIPFNGNILLTGQVFPVLAHGPIVTLNPSQVTLGPGQPYGFSTLTISTTALTTPGNYTITVQGTSGTLIHAVQFQLTILPPPVLTLSPMKGPVGTQVEVHGSGFVFQSQGFFNPVEIEMTFDDQLVGLLFPQSSSFNFTFNVPESQAGIVHVVHAKVLFFLPNLDVQANFLVLSEPSTLTVSITAGTIYFPGDTATIFVMTDFNGQLTTVTSIQVILINPKGSNTTLSTVLISPGVYRATFTVPTTGSIGTYSVIIRAHQTGSTDASGLGDFEVKPTWLSANGPKVATATSILGVVGAISIFGLAWRKGYFSRRYNEVSGS